MAAAPTLSAGQVVRAPAWLLTYSGVAINGKIDPMVLSVEYTSQVAHAASEMRVVLEDRDKRWQGPWYPTLGDLVSLEIGYAGEGLVSCGDFQVDEVELGGPPDIFDLKCIAAFIKPAMRTPNTAGYENQSLLAIATSIASKYGFSVVGAPADLNVTFERVTQRQETDLGFLRRLAVEHDYAFSVRGTQLVFYALPTLESAAALLTILRTDVERFEFKDRTHATYQSAVVSYTDPTSKKLISATATAPSGTISTGDTLKLSHRVESASQASLKAQGALHDRNRLQGQTTLTLPGNTNLAGGITVAVSGFGQFDGTYFIEKATHRLERERGYTTTIEGYLVVN